MLKNLKLKKWQEAYSKNHVLRHHNSQIIIFVRGVDKISSPKHEVWLKTDNTELAAVQVLEKYFTDNENFQESPLVVYKPPKYVCQVS